MSYLFFVKISQLFTLEWNLFFKYFKINQCLNWEFTKHDVLYVYYFLS